MKTCKDVMTPNPICCLAGDSVMKAASLMKDADIGPVPVVEDHVSGKLIGILTDRDLVLKVVAQGKDPDCTSVADVMTRDPIFCRQGESVDAAIDQMSSYQIRRIPVVDETNGIVGIISQADIATRIKNSQTIVGEVVKEISGSQG